MPAGRLVDGQPTSLSRLNAAIVYFSVGNFLQQRKNLEVTKLQYLALHRTQSKRKPTTHDDTKQDPNNKIPSGHANHDTDDCYIFHPVQEKSESKKEIVRFTARRHLSARCLASHKASFTRSMPRTKISEPTTITANGNNYRHGEDLKMRN